MLTHVIRINVSAWWLVKALFQKCWLVYRQPVTITVNFESSIQSLQNYKYDPQRKTPDIFDIKV